MEGEDLESAELIYSLDERLDGIREKIRILEKPVQETLQDIQEQLASYYSPPHKVAGLYEEADCSSPKESDEEDEAGEGSCASEGGEGPSQSAASFSAAKVKKVSLEEIRGS